jgi:hypothetical protein
MDPLDPWRDAVERILAKHAAEPYAYGDIRSKVVFDRAHDSYLVMDIGWHGYERIHDALIHVEVIDGKLWIQYDGTQDGIADELVAAGIPHNRIVLGFKPPDVRPYTDFAAA